MELRFADPKTFTFSALNPRLQKPSKESDEALLANIRTIGIINPPFVRETAESFRVIAGARRTRAAIKAKLKLIPILVAGDDMTDDGLIALSENVIRENMNAVDKWRALEDLIARGWSEENAGAALGMNVRQVRGARLLAKIHPPMLDTIAKLSPTFDQLATIAAATLDEQAEAWKHHQPRKGRDFQWRDVAHVLRKERISKSIAQFGGDEEAAFGIVWQDDLFAPANEESLYTTQVDAFISAQRAWLESHLPENSTILEEDRYGGGKLPVNAVRVWGQGDEFATRGYYIASRTGKIEFVLFRISAPTVTAAQGAGTADLKPQVRADITQKGHDMIGDMRTEALHQALLEQPLEDSTLMALLVVAFAAANVNVRGPYNHLRDDAAGSLIHDGVLTQDSAAIRVAARKVLTDVLSCRSGMSNSGILAQIAGHAIGADVFLPNMATEDFLKCLSKAALEKKSAALTLQAGPRAKDMRAAIVEHVGEGRLVLDEAHFVPSKEAMDVYRRRNAYRVLPNGRDVFGSIDDSGPDDDGGIPAEREETQSEEAVAA